MIVAVPVHDMPEKSIDFPILGMSIVMVWPLLNALLTSTSSWGNGTLLVHPCVDHIKDAVPVDVWAAGVVNVIPELPPQSPEFPVIAARFHEPAPAPVMSWKSQLEHVTVTAVIVLGVPITFDPIW